jgi:hypothetical protein
MRPSAGDTLHFLPAWTLEIQPAYFVPYMVGARVFVGLFVCARGVRVPVRAEGGAHACVRACVCAVMFQTELGVSRCSQGMNQDPPTSETFA